jgi:hypothetical protein
MSNVEVVFISLFDILHSAIDIIWCMVLPYAITVIRVKVRQWKKT